MFDLAAAGAMSDSARLLRSSDEVVCSAESGSYLDVFGQGAQSPGALDPDCKPQQTSAPAHADADQPPHAVA